METPTGTGTQTESLRISQNQVYEIVAAQIDLNTSDIVVSGQLVYYSEAAEGEGKNYGVTLVGGFYRQYHPAKTTTTRKIQGPGLLQLECEHGIASVASRANIAYRIVVM